MSKLGRNWKRYQKAVNALHIYYKSLSESQLNFHSDNSEWSLAQVIEHLYQVEYLTYHAIVERINSGIKKPSTFKHLKRYYLLSYALILPKKYKVPKAVVEADKPEINGDLVNLWVIQNAELGDYLESLPKSDRKSLVFRHPIAGPFNVKQTLGFLFYHLKHHQKQLNSIKGDRAFPNSL